MGWAGLGGKVGYLGAKGWLGPGGNDGEPEGDVGWLGEPGYMGLVGNMGDCCGYPGGGKGVVGSMGLEGAGGGSFSWGM